MPLNKLPEGSLPPVKHTIVYVEAGKEAVFSNLRTLFVTVRNEEHAVKMLELLIPGARWMALHRGHVELPTVQPTE